MPNQMIVESCEKQLAKSFDMLRDVVGRLDDDQWHIGDGTWTEVPSRAAYHAVQCAEFYIWDTNAEPFEWAKDGLRCQDCPPQRLPGREELLKTIDRIEDQTRAWLRQRGDAGLVAPNDKGADHACGLERMLYAARHMQHHVAQISHEAKRRGLGAAQWR